MDPIILLKPPSYAPLKRCSDLSSDKQPKGRGGKEGGF